MHPVTQQFLLWTNFCRQATPMKIKPPKICTDERLATQITAGYPQQRKVTPPKFYPRDIVTAKITAFTAHEVKPHLYKRKTDKFDTHSFIDTYN